MPNCKLDTHHALLCHRSCCCLSKLTYNQRGENRRLSKVSCKLTESECGFYNNVESSKSLSTQCVQPNQQRQCFDNAPQHQRSNALVAELGFLAHASRYNGQFLLKKRQTPSIFSHFSKHFSGSIQCKFPSTTVDVTLHLESLTARSKPSFTCVSFLHFNDVMHSSISPPLSHGLLITSCRNFTSY